MVNKMSGGKTFKDEYYIVKILETAPSIYKYEAPLIMRAFLKTLRYFIENAIEFSIKDVFDFKKHHKKKSRSYVGYRRELQDIPEHDTIKFKLTEKIRSYLNGRGQFKNSRHREILPDGIRRKKDMF